MRDDQDRIMQQTEMTRVFVYGTLRRGGRNDIQRYQPLPRFVTNARIRGRLYHLGRYPGLALGQGDWVQGEVYEVAPSVLVQLDHLEGLLPQPTGEYHYHGMPTGLITKLGKGVAMTLVGWSADGFPIYARYGHTNANDASSAVKELNSSWRIKANPDTGRPATSLYPMGSFLQDYEYVAGLGDLDRCNGRTGVTPEFPNGIYYYVITSTFPFVHRCLRGSTSTGG